MDIRNDRTGEVIFKESLHAPIAGVVKVREDIDRSEYEELSLGRISSRRRTFINLWFK